MRRAEDADIQSAAKQVDHNLVFSYPTVASLASYVVQLSTGKSAHNINIDSPAAHIRAMQDKIQAYTADIPYLPSGEISSERKSTEEVVLVTGTTGALGSQLLVQLLHETRVARVYAVNRPSKTPAAERQLESFEDKGLDTSLLTSSLAKGRLVLVEADTSKHQLSLDSELYEEVKFSDFSIIVLR